MNYCDFVRLGLSTNEAKTYLALVRRGSADASTIIADTKFHKKIVYDNLNKLIDKGLVSFVQEDKRLFSVASPHMLVEYVEDKKRQVSKELTLAQELAKEVERITPKQPHSSFAQVFRGKAGIRSFYSMTLAGGDFFVSGAPKQSVDIMGEVFWKNYEAKRIERGIVAKMVFSPQLRAYGDSIANKHTHIRYFDPGFAERTETLVQDDRVAIIVWVDKPMLFLIEDVYVAQTYKRQFDSLWEQAEE